ncbi:MAG: polysaccharide deacetylase family protein [Sarcina sp.]
MIKRNGKIIIGIIAAIVVIGGIGFGISKHDTSKKAATTAVQTKSDTTTTAANATITDNSISSKTVDNVFDAVDPVVTNGTGTGDMYNDPGYDATTGVVPIVNNGKGQAFATIKSSYTTVPDLGNTNTPVSSDELSQMEKGFEAPYGLGQVSPMPSWYKPNEVVPGENIIYSANSYAVPSNQVALMVSGNSTIKQKEVFLTFDDGPSIQNTQKILDILNKYGVHATFNIIGDHLQNNPQMQNLVREEEMDGDAVGDHTFTHQLPILYPVVNGVSTVNVNEFLKQINECKDLEHYILGPHFDTRELRLPGGYMSRVFYHDPHLAEFNKALDQEGWSVNDWTADSGVAATTQEISPQAMLASSTQDWQQMPQDVILLHDAGAKVDTVWGLPGVLQFFKDHGYKFMVIKNAPVNSFKNIPVDDYSTDSNQGQTTKTKAGY